MDLLVLFLFFFSVFYLFFFFRFISFRSPYTYITGIIDHGSGVSDSTFAGDICIYVIGPFPKVTRGYLFSAVGGRLKSLLPLSGSHLFLCVFFFVISVLSFFLNSSFSRKKTRAPRRLPEIAGLYVLLVADSCFFLHYIFLVLLHRIIGLITFGFFYRRILSRAKFLPAPERAGYLLRNVQKRKGKKQRSEHCILLREHSMSVFGVEHISLPKRSI